MTYAAYTRVKIAGLRVTHQPQMVRSYALRMGEIKQLLDTGHDRRGGLTLSRHLFILSTTDHRGGRGAFSSPT